MVTKRTVDIKLRTMDEMAGFCVKHLNCTPPTFEFVRNPTLVAKYEGFLLGRNLMASTILKAMNNLRSLTRFVATKWCPKEGRQTCKDHGRELELWYKDLVKKYKGLVLKEGKKVPSMHLQEAWDYSHKAYVEFCVKLKVGPCKQLLVLDLACIQHTSSLSCVEMQANGKQFTQELAQECQACVLRLLLTGIHQPPFRLGGLHYMLPSDPSTGKCSSNSPCTDPECKDHKCQKNYFHFYQDRGGQHVVCVMSHFKNDTVKGAQRFSVVAELVEPLLLQHMAHQACAPDCKTLFFSKSFREMESPYFSTLCGDALTPPERGRLTALTFRHLFQTMYRDFIHKPATQLMQVTRDELQRAGALLMLSSTDAVDTYYDDGEGGRALELVLQYWPQFKTFVREHHVDVTSRKVWNFMQELPSIPGLTLHALG